MAALTLAFDVLARDNASRVFDKVGDSAQKNDRKVGGFGKAMGGLAKVAGGAALAGIAGFGAALFQGVKDAASYEQITDQLAQTLESTGGAAGVSVDQLKQYAGQLESISGVDEELILSSQNVLATFTNLKDGVGAGNKIFSQASQAALNLSTTMGGDLQGATVMVGKALNDPLKGITALSKAGVQLTADQKKLIKEMVATGDVAGAQKIILGELEVQFGGAAAAAGEGLTGALARAKDAFSDIFRTLGEKLLPVLADVAEWAAEKLPPAFVAIQNAITPVVEFFKNTVVPFFKDGMQTVKDAFSGGADGTGESMRKVREVIEKAVKFADEMFKSLRTIVQDVTTIVLAIWDAFGETFIDTITGALKGVMLALEGAFTVIEGILDVFIGIFTGDWQRAWDGVQQILEGAWKVIKGVVELALAALTGAAGAFFIAFGAVFVAGWEGLKSLSESAFRFVVDKFLGMVGKIVEGAATAFGWVPGLGPKLREAAEKIAGFRDAANVALGGVKKSVSISADTRAAYGNVDALMQYINSRKGTVRIAGVTSLGGITARAAGGPLAAGQMSWVGELGPELVQFDRPSYVHDAKTSAAMTGGGDPALRAEVAGLRDDVRSLVRDFTQRQRAMT